jgi:hypothetical protein
LVSPLLVRLLMCRWNLIRVGRSLGSRFRIFFPLSARVEGAYCCAPSPSEPRLRLSPHTAQADHYRPCCLGPCCSGLSFHLGVRLLSRSWHLTCPSDFSSPFSNLQVVHQTHVSTPFSWAYALSAGLWIPLAFGLAAFASWVFVSRWRIPPLLRRAYRQSRTPTGFPRSALRRHGRGGCHLYSGAVRCPRVAE